ncbi:MAG TPA: zinc ribbon domain-containing protein [Terracidiphilus sp.]|jgi:hypothetical protein|nr:zinc ribbon domain-containing protein [Terracidiphilus sp.]
MSKFCGTCGSSLNEGQKFCGKCGGVNAANPQIPAEQPYASPAPPAFAPVAQPQPVVASTPARSNALLKVGIAAVVIIFVGGIAALGAVYYVVHKVKEKVQAVAHQVESDTPSSTASGIASLVQKAAASAATKDSDSTGFNGDPCRFLSKEDVSRAVGIEIIRADPQGPGCNYIAKGDPADMVSKHMTSMVTSQAKSNGSNPTAEQTKMMQQITGAFFKQQESSDKDLSKEAKGGEVPILSVSFSSGNAEMEMKMNRMGFNSITGSNAEGKTTDQSASGDLDGIGDEAYEMGGTGIIVRKGQTIARFMFPYCPCDANAIKPLAANLANKM